ncbi:patatin-like phospholipase family protein [Ideonella sp.]|uniref:patatin-like phospholipase family protein n=1 Tax=Ideonella sp. TaxID=1929293 RepID=UPI003BB52168
MRLPILLVCLLLWPLAPARAEPGEARPDNGPSASRPRVGLVLSGGGARGLTHVGVLKILEREHIPVDVIAGTSMGAIIGGLYASGMSAAEIESELKKINWGRIFSMRVGRQQLSQRRKEEDFELSTAIELGYRDGAFRAPQSAVSSRGLETLLRRYTLPVRGIQDFDYLPIPFRALATDMETGDAVVLAKGDLATALRSSMSVPGVFPPTEVDGQILGDGGLVNNVPVDIARAMGADVVIVVNIGTPLSGRETLSSVIGLTAQMINILTEQNVKRSLASLGSADILITPELGPLTSGDFEKTAEFIAIGQNTAEAMTSRLNALALPAAEYAQWREARRAAPPPVPTLQFVDFEGTVATNPHRLEPQLQSKRGEPFDQAKAERDTQYLAASGDYVRTDYRLEGDGIVFDLEDKPWGPNYINAGLDLSTDFNGNSAFNIKLSHHSHWLTDSGTEWRNRLQIGETPFVYTELYHPLTWTIGLSNDWFVSGWAAGERRNLSIFESNGGDKIGEVQRDTVLIGFDLGQPWSHLGELRLGLNWRVASNEPLLYTRNQAVSRVELRESMARARVVMDQLDYANFPSRGYRLDTELSLGQRQDPERGKLARFQLEGTTAFTWNQQTLNLHGAVKVSNSLGDTGSETYALGGFQQLSGYQAGQVAGNALLFGRVSWYRRFANPPVFARGLFMGVSLEIGDAWKNHRDMRLAGMRQAGSVFLGADTGIGPLYLGITYAPRGEAGLILFIGRP